MKTIVFSARSYDRDYLSAANKDRHSLTFVEHRLTPETALMAAGFEAACLFVNDDGHEAALRQLAREGVRMLALRSAGFSHVDLQVAAELGVAVGRVPAYSPHAVAEHTLALILALNRKIHRAYNRVREGNFALEGLLGFDMVGKTVGIVGTGEIGSILARIVTGLGCKVLATDPKPSPRCTELGVAYVPIDELLQRSDVITLNCPLTPQTRHLINADAVSRMKPGVTLINTSRGAVVDTRAVLSGLKSGHIGGLGLDVYEEEESLFFEDRSHHAIPDDVFARLLTFPNVLITGHQAFFTHEALTAIAETTIGNISQFEDTGAPLHPVSA